MNKVQNYRKKIGIIIAIVIAVLVLGIAGFFVGKSLQPKTNVVNKDVPSGPKITTPEHQTDFYEGWGTYISQRDGYELRYPPDWIVIKETASDGPYIRNMAFTGGGYPEGYINLRVLRDVGTVSGSTLSPKDWYAALGVSTVQKGPVTFPPDVVEDFILNGMNAKKAKSVFTETDADVFILHNDMLYEINMYPYEAPDNVEVQNILNSFTFI